MIGRGRTYQISVKDLGGVNAFQPTQDLIDESLKVFILKFPFRADQFV